MMTGHEVPNPKPSFLDLLCRLDPVNLILAIVFLEKTNNKRVKKPSTPLDFILTQTEGRRK